MQRLRFLFSSLALFSTFLLAAPGSAQEIPWKTLVDQFDEFQYVVSNDELPLFEKKKKVDALFRTLTDLCVDGCQPLLEGSKGAFPDVELKLIGAFVGSKLGPPFDKVGRHSSEIIEKFTALRSELERKMKADPELLRRQISTAITALRLLTGFEEEHLFKLGSQDPGLREEGKKRLAKDLSILTQQGIAVFNLLRILNSKDAEKTMSPETVKQVVRHISDLGIFYIKLAQTMSCIELLDPSALGQAIRMFQEDSEPIPPEQAVAILRHELGRDPSEVFTDFDPTKPMASGSMATIFRGKIKTWVGKLKPVAIKIQRPGLQEALDYNRKINRLVAHLWSFKEPKPSAITELVLDSVRGLEDDFESELDFPEEGLRTNHFRRMFWLHPNVVIPKAYLKYTSPMVLVTDEVAGMNPLKAVEGPAHTKLTGLSEEEKESAFDTQRRKSVGKLLANFVDATSYMTLWMKNLHADLQAGNLRINKLKEEGEEPSPIAPPIPRLANEIPPWRVKKNGMGILDFGQSVKTGGLIFHPVLLGYYAVTKNAAGFAKHMIPLGKDPNFSRKELEEIAERKFAESKYEVYQLPELAKVLFESKSADYETNVATTVAEIFLEAVAKRNFRFTSKYVQLGRSLGPALGLTIYLGTELTPTQAFFGIGAGLARGALLGGVKYSLLRGPTALLNAVDRGRVAYKTGTNRKKPPLVLPETETPDWKSHCGPAVDWLVGKATNFPPTPKSNH